MKYLPLLALAFKAYSNTETFTIEKNEANKNNFGKVKPEFFSEQFQESADSLFAIIQTSSSKIEIKTNIPSEMEFILKEIQSKTSFSKEESKNLSILLDMIQEMQGKIEASLWNIELPKKLNEGFDFSKLQSELSRKTKIEEEKNTFNAEASQDFYENAMARQREHSLYLQKAEINKSSNERLVNVKMTNGSVQEMIESQYKSLRN